MSNTINRKHVHSFRFWITLIGIYLIEIQIIQTTSQDIFAQRIFNYNEDVHKRKRRAAILTNALKWPNSVVPYIVDKHYFTNDELEGLHFAIQTWNNETCVKFRKYRRGDKHWLRITDGPSCYSQFVGFGNKGEQTVTFSKNGCRYFGLFAHELGHVIGLDHEHTRSDRDEFVKINIQGVPNEFKSFYDKKKSSNLKTYNTSYDLQSVMHYGPESFSTHEGKSSVTVSDKKMTHLLQDVYTKDVSFLDAKSINFHYNCNSRCNKIDLECRHPGYINHNCICQTPSIYMKRRCVDRISKQKCIHLSNQLECSRNASFMAIHCRLTCKFCYQNMVVQMQKNIIKASCGDHHKNCSDWKKNNFCEKNSKYMRLMCPQSCNICQNVKVPIDHRTAACFDRYQHPADCIDWSLQGNCERNPIWMKRNCAKSCKFCSVITSSTSNITQSQQVASCKDLQEKEYCQRLSRSGYCKQKKNWMTINCNNSCGFCDIRQEKEMSKTTDNLVSDANSITSVLLSASSLFNTVSCISKDPSFCPLSSKACLSSKMFKDCPKLCKNCGKCEDRNKYCKVLQKNGYCTKYPLSTLRYCRKTCRACDS